MNATNLDDKVIIVTAGAGGIGSTVVKLANERGAKIAIANMSVADAEVMAHDICAAGGDAIAVEVDLGNEDMMKAAVKSVADHYGRIDVLANNAALISQELAMRDQNIEKMETEVWDRTFNVNARGTMIMSRECLPHLVETKGNIVNTVSNLALQGHVIQVAYSSSKAAIIQMTRGIAASHGRKGVRCNAVAPGMTMTPALKEGIPAPIRELMEAETLRDKLGEPEDIGEVIVWLASDAARNVTGQLIVSDGGLASHVPGYGALLDIMNQGA